MKAHAFLPRFLCRWAPAFLLALLLGVPHALAEEDSAPKDGEGSDMAEEGELTEASKDEAKKLLDALKKVYKKKNATKILPLLEPMDGLKHESWEKPLLKLLKHQSSLVALKVAGMWDGRVRDKTVKKVWKAGWLEKVNDKRFPIKAKVLLAIAGGAPADAEPIDGTKRPKSSWWILDKAQYKEVERDWRWMVGNPNERYADALIDICLYFEKTKDKRFCRWLAQELDEPTAESPNSPSNPPAEWWERRWKMWKPMKPAAVAALKAITGQEFDKTEDARKWLKENEKTFGFQW